MDERERIGLLVQSIRVSKELSQMQLAELTGLQQRTISKVENGLFNVSLETLSKICKALDCKIDIVKVAE